MAITGRNTKTVNNQWYFENVKSLLAEGKNVKISIKGNSMLPFLREGDTALLRPCAQGMTKGRIVLASYRNGYVLHRIARLEGDFLELTGDNNLVLHERVRKEDLIAELLEAYRDNEDLHIYSRRKLLVARAWYSLRPLRRLYGRLFKRTNY